MKENKDQRDQLLESLLKQNAKYQKQVVDLTAKNTSYLIAIQSIRNLETWKIGLNKTSWIQADPVAAILKSVLK